jgi:hypothetical protein
LAFWCKQQALLFFPLIVLIVLARRAAPIGWLRLGLTLGVGCAALLIWDGARLEASIFLQAAVNNAPGAWLAPLALWAGRLAAWSERGLWLLGPPLATAGLLLAYAVVSLRRMRQGSSGSGRRWLELAMLLYVLVFLGAHSALAINLYDRYLLLILPPLVLLVAGRMAETQPMGARGKRWRLVLLALVAAGGLWSAATGPGIGGDRGEQAGIDALAAHLVAKPVATVVYDPWLGWELGYYLGQWHDKRRVYYPTAAALAAGALALEEIGDRYFVAPVDQPHDEWLAALKVAGFGFEVDYERDRFVVYRLRVP